MDIQGQGDQGGLQQKSPSALQLYAPAAVSAILFLVCLFLFFQNSSLSASLSSLNSTVISYGQKIEQLSSKNANLSSMLSEAKSSLSKYKSDLAAANEKIAALETESAQKSERISQLESELSSEQAKRGQLAQEYSELQQSISQSMAWFRENAVFPENFSWSSSAVARRIGEDCIEKGSLNLGCLSYMLENVGFAIHYRTDVSKNGTETDHLQSLEETIRLGWGDCEDYSLLVKSLINLFKQKNASLSLLAWQPGGGSDFRIYPPESKSSVNEAFWYYPNAHGENIGKIGSIFPYVACYNVDSRSGHCVVAISQQEISSSSDVPKLFGAKLFEPQNGMYLGTIGSEFDVCSAGLCTLSPKTIYIVISDKDLYMHNGKGWKGYEDYAEEAGKAIFESRFKT